MRSTFPTRDEVDQARQTFLPQLRDFARHCRKDRPLAPLPRLTAAHRVQYDIIHARMMAFDANSAFREESVCILHSSHVGLLAARDVFSKFESRIVYLLPDEKADWFNRLHSVVDGWYWHLWWTIHEKVPGRFANVVRAYFPMPDAWQYWVLSEGRGTNARHELWKWDGASAEFVGRLCSICSEEGPIDEWYE